MLDLLTFPDYTPKRPQLKTIESHICKIWQSFVCLSPDPRSSSWSNRGFSSLSTRKTIRASRITKSLAKSSTNSEGVRQSKSMTQSCSTTQQSEEFIDSAIAGNICFLFFFSCFFYGHD